VPALTDLAASTDLAAAADAIAPWSASVLAFLSFLALMFVGFSKPVTQPDQAAPEPEPVPVGTADSVEHGA
jgi:hypothetical protein